MLSIIFWMLLLLASKALPRPTQTLQDKYKIIVFQEKKISFWNAYLVSRTCNVTQSTRRRQPSKWHSFLRLKNKIKFNWKGNYHSFFVLIVYLGQKVESCHIAICRLKLLFSFDAVDYRNVIWEHKFNPIGQRKCYLIF